VPGSFMRWKNCGPMRHGWIGRGNE
jgi:hypothetical protein